MERQPTEQSIDSQRNEGRPLEPRRRIVRNVVYGLIVTYCLGVGALFTGYEAKRAIEGDFGKNDEVVMENGYKSRAFDDQSNLGWGIGHLAGAGFVAYFAKIMNGSEKKK